MMVPELMTVVMMTTVMMMMGAKLTFAGFGSS